MDNAEFKLIVRELCHAFPNVNSWLRYNATDPHRTLATWHRALRGVALVDAYAVLDLMTCGELEPLNQYELWRTALYIRQHAQDIRRGRYAVLRRLEHQHQEQVETAHGDPLPPGVIRDCYRLGQQAHSRYPGEDEHDTRKRWIDQQLQELGYRVEEN